MHKQTLEKLGVSLRLFQNAFEIFYLPNFPFVTSARTLVFSLYKYLVKATKDHQSSNPNASPPHQRHRHV